MAKSNFIALILVHYTVKLSLIGLVVALSGTRLASVITPNARCRYHLVFNNISMWDLPTTRNMPVTLTKRTFSDDLSLSSYHTTNRSLQLDILHNKGWMCETVILFVTINPD